LRAVWEKGAILKNVLYLPSLPPPAPPWQGGGFFSFLPLAKGELEGVGGGKQKELES